MNIKPITNHQLTDFIPTAILDKTESHYLVIWELGRITDGETSSTQFFANKNSALNKLSKMHDRHSTSEVVKSLQNISVSGINSHYEYSYIIEGDYKEIYVTKTTVKIG